jgi:hypothetical protein
MTNIKPIHLRRDEFNTFIEENKLPLMVDESASITNREKQVIEHCGVDYGLETDKTLVPDNSKNELIKYNIIMRIKGNFTLPNQAQFRSENGPVIITPYIIHDDISSKRYHIVAKELIDKKLVSSPVTIDEEYMYEALRETSFTVDMEEITRMGTEFQILQVEFDTDGHFKVIELDESITS